MGRLRVILLFAFATVALTTQAQENSPILRLDPAIDEIVPPDAKVEKVADNFDFVEGPAWVRKGGYLIFSDVPKNVINKWNPKDNKVSVFLGHSGFTGSDPTGIGAQQSNGREVVYLIGSNGITLDPQGRVVFNAHGDRQIVRLENDGKRTVLVSRYEGKRLNSPNDLVFKSDGSLYFTDSSSGLRGREQDPTKELPFNGVYLLKDGKVHLLLDDLLPNGIALDPDEKHLYVNDNGTMTIRRYDIQRDGTIANGKVFFSLGVRGPGGTKVDKQGNVYCTGAGGVRVISPQGKHLGTIRFPQDISNLAFGDADGKTLFVTGRTELYRIRLKIPGILP